MLSNQAAYPHLIVIVVIAIVIGVSAVLAQVLLLRRMNRSKLPAGIRICLEILLSSVFTAVLAVMLHTAVMGTVYAHIDYHFNQIGHGMPIAEVRRSLCWLYEESDISFEDLSKDMSKHDFSIDIPDGVKVRAKKYADRIFGSEYMYVVFDERDRVWARIDMYEYGGGR